MSGLKTYEITQTRTVKIRSTTPSDAMVVAEAVLEAPGLSIMPEEAKGKGHPVGEVETTEMVISLERF